MKACKVMVTGGATIVPIDKVRAITNIFRGRTGTKIACFFQDKGCDVTFLTSNPDIAQDFKGKLITYKTFDDLYEIMRQEIATGAYDVVIHSAAVSDYICSAVCAMDEKGKLTELDKSKKVSSSHKEMYLKLTQTPKIIDQIRGWGFKGSLVKFKLQVGISDEELLNIARKSRTDSNADIIVANCLEWSRDRAYVINAEKELNVQREDLPLTIFSMVCDEK